MAIIKVTDQTFKKEVLENSKPVCVKAEASWCGVQSPRYLTGGRKKGPCQQLSPIVSKISDEMTDVHFVSFDIEEAVNTATELSIRSIPQMYIYKNGQVVAQKPGATDYQSVKNWIKENI